MATAYELNDVAVQMFHDRWINLLTQRQHKLANTYQLVTGAVGDGYKWPRAGNVDMNERTGNAFQHIPASFLDYTQLTTTFTPYQLKLPSDTTFTQKEVNVSEISNFAEKHQQAIMRRQDQLILDALFNSSTTNIIAAGSAQLTVQKIAEAGAFARIENWDENDGWHIAIHANEWQYLVRQTQVASSDYNDMKPLTTGMIDTYLGFKFHVFGELSTGGLNLTSTTRTCFAWNAKKVGLVYNLSPEVHVFPMVSDMYVDTVSVMQVGSQILEDAGVIKILVDESVTT
jgi:hypothetical protein